MVLRKWEDLPDWLKTNDVKGYYEILEKHKTGLVIKRIFDVVTASLLLVGLAPIMLIIMAMIKKDSKGSVFYRQERVTAYGRKFKIHKFRTMVNNADQIGTQVTTGNDSRITKIGYGLRKYRLDEIPQLIDVLQGTMSFVGTRPEAVKYVKAYTPEMRATLLMPAGITSLASIKYKNEAKLLDSVENVDDVYIEEILPAKMAYNLEDLKQFGVLRDVKIMIKTVIAVLK